MTLATSIKEIRGAAIEIGTNSVKYFLGKVIGKNRIERIGQGVEITRLGKGLQPGGFLREDSIERTLRTVGKFRDMAQKEGIDDIIVFGTQSLRISKNPDDFIERVRKELNLDVEVIPGDWEAHLTRVGVLLDFPKEERGEPVIIDIGGGSTEVIMGISTKSIPMGCVNLTETMIHRDPPDRESLIRLHARIRDQFIEEITFLNPGHKADCVGVGGTIVTLAMLSLGLEEFSSDKIHGVEIKEETVKEIFSRLTNMNLEERKGLIKFDPGRADVIIAGMAILQAFFNFIAMHRFTVSIYNIIHGIFYDYYSRKFFEF